MSQWKHVLRQIGAVALVALAAGGAIADEPIRIGFVGPLSGPFGEYGRKFQNAMKAYQKVNGDMVAGRPVEIIYRDTSSGSPDVAKRLAQELIVRDKVDVLTGFALTPDAFAAAPLSTVAKTPMVLMLAAASGLPANFPYVTRVSYSNSQASAPIGLWAAKNGVKKVFTLVSDYSPGIDCETAFVKSFMASGGQVAGSVRIPLTAIDFSPYLQRVVDSGADAVFVFVPSGDPMTGFMKSFTERGLDRRGVRVLANTDLSQEYLRLMGDAALNVISGTHFFETLDTPANRTFQRVYQEIAGEPGGAIAIGGWDGLAAIYEAVKKTGGKFDGTSLMQAFRGLRLESPRGPLLLDPETKDVVQTIYIAKVEKRGTVYAPVVIDRYEGARDIPR
jgi:branched-chain amino acid transport system substrate-binding protein